MASDEDSTLNSGPLGGLIGLTVLVLGMGSTIWWHAPGAVTSSAMGWLMAPLPHTVFKIMVVSAMLIALVFGTVVVFFNRVNQGWDLPSDSVPDPAPSPAPPVGPPPMAPHARQSDIDGT